MLTKITDDMKQAMKSGDKVRLNAIRMFRSALKDREIEVGRSLEDEDVTQIAARLIKQRKDAANQYQQAERLDLADKELAEAEILMQYMPEQMNAEAVAKAVNEAIASTNAAGMKDMGKVMGALKALQGKADMGLVSAQVKASLQG